jgi:FkbM family methyltransferase
MLLPDGGTATPASAGARWRDQALIAYGRSVEHPSKIRIVRWLARRLAGGRIHVRYARGATIEIDPADYIGWAVFMTGHYEPATLGLALRIMAREPGLFVDVGAAFGWYACAVAALAGCTVVAIEPDCENCARLRTNVGLGRLANVAVFNGAVGAKAEAVGTARRVATNSGTVTLRPDGGLAGDWVPTLPLETLLRRMIDPPARPVLMKIDVEGVEADVVAGLDLDGPFRPKNILMELDPQLSSRSWTSFCAARDFFAAKGYDVVDVRGQPIRDPHSIAEQNLWIRERAAQAAA